jgi:hypothetical protein
VAASHDALVHPPRCGNTIYDVAVRDPSKSLTNFISYLLEKFIDLELDELPEACGCIT